MPLINLDKNVSVNAINRYNGYDDDIVWTGKIRIMIDMKINTPSKK